VRRYPHVEECTLPLRVLAVQCAPLQNRYGTLRKRYVTIGGVKEALRNRCGALQERYGAVAERCGYTKFNV